jgi:hypothetical protein
VNTEFESENDVEVLVIYSNPPSTAEPLVKVDESIDADPLTASKYASPPLTDSTPQVAKEDKEIDTELDVPTESNPPLPDPLPLVK